MKLLIIFLTLLTTIAANAYADLSYLQNNVKNKSRNLKALNKKENKIYGDVTIGASDTSGNTDNSAASANGNINKEFQNSLWENKGNIFYAANDNKMNQKRWLGYSGYSLNFGKDDRWFNNYQITVDHDRFANIDYRILPATGIGYWTSNKPDYIFKNSLGIGYEYIELRENDPTTETETVALIFDSYFKKKIFEKSFITQEINIVPSLKFEAGIRGKSISTFTNAINSKLSIDIKYTVLYDSEPSNTATSTDKIFVLGIKYKF